MNFLVLELGVVCLFPASMIFAQELVLEKNAVSIYELSHKADKQTRRLLHKGWAELQKKNYDLSINLFQEALRTDPLNWSAANNMGYAYTRSGKLELAKTAFARAIEIDPANPVAHVNLGICALNGNDYQNAEAAARQALRLEPTMREGKALLGIAQVGQGHWTPQVHKLLEDSRGCSLMVEKLLHKWPATGSAGQRLVIRVTFFQ